MTHVQTPTVTASFSNDAGPAAASAGPLSEEDYRLIELARTRRKRINRATAVATFSAWSLAVAAAISLPLAFFGVAGLIAFACTAAMTSVEFKGRAMLRRLDPTGLKLMAGNQLVFLVLITAYCLWQIYMAATHPDQLMRDLPNDPQLRQMMASYAGLYQTLTLVVYGSVILASVIFQGGLSLFYYSRLSHLRAYRRETPEWIVKLEEGRG